MADFIDIINIRGHMCQKYFLECSIHKCPLYKQTAAGCGDCAAWIVGHPHEAQSVIMNWLDREGRAECTINSDSSTSETYEHRPTMLSYFFEHKENHRIGMDGLPKICPRGFNDSWTGSIGDGFCNEVKDCWECWTRPVPNIETGEVK